MEECDVPPEIDSREDDGMWAAEGGGGVARLRKGAGAKNESEVEYSKTGNWEVFVGAVRAYVARSFGEKLEGNGKAQRVATV